MDVNDFCRRLEAALQLPAQSLQPDTRFTDIPNFGSLAQIEVILLLDELYGVQLAEEQLPQLARIADLAPLVEQAGTAVSG